METSALEGVLAAVRDALGGVLVLWGEAGVGETALLDRAAEHADDMQVARVAGAEAEMDMGFVGLHQLLVPFLSGLEELPAPQWQALGSAALRVLRSDARVSALTSRRTTSRSARPMGALFVTGWWPRK